MCFLLSQQIDMNDIDIDKILDKLATIKHKNYFSQCKNALKQFCVFNHINLDFNSLQKIESLQHTRKKKYRKINVISYKQIVNSISHLKNEKLKLSFLTMMKTGLRVSELSQIAKKDCGINEKNIITFCFIGKGNKEQKVIVEKEEDIKYFVKLYEHIVSLKDNDKLFYSSAYLQAKAKTLNFKTIDLRRIFAHVEYKKTKSKKQVMLKMRHKCIKTTNIYLHSKIKF